MDKIIKACISEWPRFTVPAFPVKTRAHVLRAVELVRKALTVKKVPHGKPFIKIHPDLTREAMEHVLDKATARFQPEDFPNRNPKKYQIAVDEALAHNITIMFDEVDAGEDEEEEKKEVVIQKLPPPTTPTTTTTTPTPTTPAPTTPGNLTHMDFADAEEAEEVICSTKQLEISDSLQGKGKANPESCALSRTEKANLRVLAMNEPDKSLQVLFKEQQHLAAFVFPSRDKHQMIKLRREGTISSMQWLQTIAAHADHFFSKIQKEMKSNTTLLGKRDLHEQQKQVATEIEILAEEPQKITPQPPKEVIPKRKTLPMEEEEQKKEEHRVVEDKISPKKATSSVSFHMVAQVGALGEQQRTTTDNVLANMGERITQLENQFSREMKLVHERTEIVEEKITALNNDIVFMNRRNTKASQKLVQYLAVRAHDVTHIKDERLLFETMIGVERFTEKANANMLIGLQEGKLKVPYGRAIEDVFYAQSDVEDEVMSEQQSHHSSSSSSEDSAIAAQVLQQFRANEPYSFQDTDEEIEHVRLAEEEKKRKELEEEEKKQKELEEEKKQKELEEEEKAKKEEERRIALATLEKAKRAAEEYKQIMFTERELKRQKAEEALQAQLRKIQQEAEDEQKYLEAEFARLAAEASKWEQS